MSAAAKKGPIMISRAALIYSGLGAASLYVGVKITLWAEDVQEKRRLEVQLHCPTTISSERWVNFCRYVCLVQQLVSRTPEQVSPPAVKSNELAAPVRQSSLAGQLEKR